MSSKEDLLREIEEVRGSLRRLEARLSAVEQEVGASTFVLVEEPRADPVLPLQSKEPEEIAKRSQPQTGPLTWAGVAPSSSLPDQVERELAAKETGKFFLRCLAGVPRRSSGRAKLRLQNNYYVVIRSLAGEVFTDPVRVYRHFSSVRQLVSEGGRSSRFGDSIFAGFADLWEVQLAIAEAGFSWSGALLD